MKKELTSEQEEFIFAKSRKNNEKSFSWGAFSLGIFYFLAMNSWGAAIALILSIVVGFKVYFDSGQNASFAIPFLASVYLAVIARKSAWKDRKWDDFSEFRKVQEAWDRWGKAILFIEALLIGLELVLTYGY